MTNYERKEYQKEGFAVVAEIDPPHRIHVEVRGSEWWMKAEASQFSNFDGSTMGEPVYNWGSTRKTREQAEEFQRLLKVLLEEAPKYLKEMEE